MNRTDWRLTAPHLTLAAFVAAGLSAAPFGFGDGLTPHTSTATAQASGSGSGSSGGSDGSGAGGSDDGTAGDEGAAGAAGDTDGTGTSGAQTVPTGQDPGIAEESATAAGTDADTEENVYEILGTTREQAEAADTHTSATAQYGPLAAYQAEVERGNLDAAAENLAAIAEDPITEEMVTEVNTELGVETTLTAKQIADAAARKQDEGS